MIIFLLVLHLCSFTLATHTLIPSRGHGLSSGRLHFWDNFPRRKAILLSINSRPVKPTQEHGTPFREDNLPPTFKFPIRSDFNSKGNEGSSKVTLELPIYKPYDFNKYISKVSFYQKNNNHWLSPTVGHTTYYNPSKLYELPTKPDEEYGPPKKLFETYEVSEKSSDVYGSKPAEIYGPPEKPAVIFGSPKNLCETYELPTKPSAEYGPPKRLFETYEVLGKLADVYGLPSKPAETYGPPEKTAVIYGPSKKLYKTYDEYPIKLSEEYGPPKKLTIKPAEVYGPPLKSAETYGPTIKPPSKESFEIHGFQITPAEAPWLPEEPAETYGPPKDSYDVYKLPKTPSKIYGPPRKVCEHESQETFSPTDVKLDYKTDFSLPIRSHVDFNKQTYWFTPENENWQTSLWENTHNQHVPGHSSQFDGISFDVPNDFNENNYFARQPKENIHIFSSPIAFHQHGNHEDVW